MSTNLTTGPTDDIAVTAALRAVMALDGMQQAAFAARLAAMDARFADGLGVLIMDAVGLPMPPPLGMVIGGPALSLDATQQEAPERHGAA